MKKYLLKPPDSNSFKLTPNEMKKMSEKLSELADVVCDDIFDGSAYGSFTSHSSPRNS